MLQSQSSFAEDALSSIRAVGEIVQLHPSTGGTPTFGRDGPKGHCKVGELSRPL